MRTALKFAAIWMACVAGRNLLVFGLEFGALGAGRRLELARSWAVTTGQVVASEPGNHNSIVVRYTVDGHQIAERFTQSGKLAGQAVEIFYSPGDPGLADIRNPATSISEELRFCARASVALGSYLAAVTCFRSIRRRDLWRAG